MRRLLTVAALRNRPLFGAATARERLPGKGYNDGPTVLTTLIRIGLCLGAAAMLPAQGADAVPELDYLFFKERVQPVFLSKRAGHARCVTCHEHRSPQLAPLEPEASEWTNEQSRQNFEMWKQFVVPGKPSESRLLLHPLEASAGGDIFHAGGKHWQSKADPEWQTIAAWVRGQRLGGLAMEPTSGAVRVLQTNAAGDNIHVIDPASNEIVGLIEGIEVPHGVVIAPDGKRIYVSNEARQTLDVVDVKTLEVFKRIPLSGRPNNLDVANDGSKVYVAIREEPGAVDVIDAVALTAPKTISVEGPVHNVFFTPDGTHVIAGSIETKMISVIDVSRDVVSWTMEMDAGVRPIAFLQGGDGSTRQMFVQLSGLHGFAIVDYGKRQETARLTFPAPEGREAESESLQGSPAHGIVVSPDQKVVWSTSKYYGAVYAFGVPGRCREGYEKKDERCDWEMLAMIDVGPHPDWLAMTPDGKLLYVAVAGADETAVIDTESMTVVDRIRVGNVPKRNIAGMLATR